MKIIGIIREESLGNEIVLLTDPPITPELIGFHNQRKGNRPETSLGARDGKLVVTRQQYEKWRGAIPSFAGAEMLAAELTRVQKELDKAPANAPTQQDRWVAEMKFFFGVPVKSAKEFQAFESPSA